MAEPSNDERLRELDGFWQESLDRVLDAISIGALAEIAELDEPRGIACPVIQRARERVPDSARVALSETIGQEERRAFLCSTCGYMRLAQLGAGSFFVCDGTLAGSGHAPVECEVVEVVPAAPSDGEGEADA